MGHRRSGRGTVYSVVLGLERFPVRAIGMAWLFAWGALGEGLPKVGECGGDSILCLAGSLPLLGGSL